MEINLSSLDTHQLELMMAEVERQLKDTNIIEPIAKIYKLEKVFEQWYFYATNDIEFVRIFLKTSTDKITLKSAVFTLVSPVQSDKDLFRLDFTTSDYYTKKGIGYKVGIMDMVPDVYKKEKNRDYLVVIKQEILRLVPSKAVA